MFAQQDQPKLQTERTSLFSAPRGRLLKGGGFSPPHLSEQQPKKTPAKVSFLSIVHPLVSHHGGKRKEGLAVRSRNVTGAWRKHNKLINLLGVRVFFFSLPPGSLIEFVLVQPTFGRLLCLCVRVWSEQRHISLVH